MLRMHRSAYELLTSTPSRGPLVSGAQCVLVPCRCQGHAACVWPPCTLMRLISHPRSTPAVLERDPHLARRFDTVSAK
jgi:hypothetical protein